MLSEDAACNPRNLFAGRVRGDGTGVTDRELYDGDHDNHQNNNNNNNNNNKASSNSNSKSKSNSEGSQFFGGDMPCHLDDGGAPEIDYRGGQVTVEAFLRVLTGRVEESAPRGKHLNSGPNSNVLLFLTGHSGENFIKFQDATTLSSGELGAALRQAKRANRFREMLFILDTCHGESLFDDISSPGILALTSSHRHQDSLSMPVSHDIGLASLDRFSAASARFFDNSLPFPNITSGGLITDAGGGGGGGGAKNGRRPAGRMLSVQEYFDHIGLANIRSEPRMRSDLFTRTPKETDMTSFFTPVGARRETMLDKDVVPLLLPVAPLSPTSSINNVDSGCVGSGSSSGGGGGDGNMNDSPAAAGAHLEEEIIFLKGLAAAEATVKESHGGKESIGVVMEKVVVAMMVSDGIASIAIAIVALVATLVLMMTN